MIVTRTNGKYCTASDLSCAHHQVPLSDETQKVASFIWWKTIHLSGWIVRTLWTLTMVQSNDGN